MIDSVNRATMCDGVRSRRGKLAQRSEVWALLLALATSVPCTADSATCGRGGGEGGALLVGIHCVCRAPTVCGGSHCAHAHDTDSSTLSGWTASRCSDCRCDSRAAIATGTVSGKPAPTGVGPPLPIAADSVTGATVQLHNTSTRLGTRLSSDPPEVGSSKQATQTSFARASPGSYIWPDTDSRNVAAIRRHADVVDSALQSALPSALHSTWSCKGVGTLEQGMVERSQSCLFQNVVITPAGQLRLYVGKPGVTAQHDIDVRAKLAHLGTQFTPQPEAGASAACLPKLRMRRGGFGSHHPSHSKASDDPELQALESEVDELWESTPDDMRTCLNTTVVAGDPPVGIAVHSAPLAIFYEPFAPENFGHYLFDDLFVNAALMADFDLLGMTPDVAFIARRPCQFISGRTSWSRCRGRYSQIGALFTNHPLITMLGTKSLGVEVGQPLPGSGPHGTFFKSLLVGRPLNPFRDGMKGRSSLWVAVKEHILGALGIPVTGPVPKEHHIVVVAKVGDDGVKTVGVRRAVINMETVVARLRLLAGVTVTVLTPYRGYPTFQQELELLRNATLWIAPCGGASMTAGFMRTNTAILILDYLQQENGGTTDVSTHMEAPIWEHMFTIQSHYYAVDSTQMRPIENLPPRHWNYKLNETKLVTQVKTILHQVGQSHGIRPVEDLGVRHG